MTDLLVLAGVAAPFVVTPGASFTLTLAHATDGYRSSWLRVVTGSGCGIVLLALCLGATGVGDALTAMPTVRLLLGLIGGVVLVIVGGTLLRRLAQDPPVTSQSSAGPRSLVQWSFVALVTNPKALTVYVVVVPQLCSTRLSGGRLFLAFAGVHIALMTVWLFLVDWAATRLSTGVTAERTRRLVFGAAALVTVALGATTIVGAIRAT
jgi:threonine/homoserine/homoserine lactone efflux protein